MGNRLSKTVNQTSEGYTYNAANMLLTRGNGSYANDANGKTLTGGGRTNTWDEQNRLTQCVFQNVTSTFVYGADGLRRQSTTSGVTTDYLLDGQNVVRTTDSNSSSVTYLAGPRGPEYERSGNNAPKWNLYDGLGSVIGTVDGSGNILSKRKYDIYGAVRGLTGQNGTKHMFVGGLGHPNEDGTGLIYMRSRHYDPLIGRFLSEDPSGDGVNWYLYADGNPTNNTDSTGRYVEEVYNQAVVRGGLLAITSLILVIQGNQLRQQLALSGIFLAKGAKENTGHNTIENELTDRIAKELGMTGPESDRLHRDLGKIGKGEMTDEEIRQHAEDIIGDRGGGFRK